MTEEYRHPLRKHERTHFYKYVTSSTLKIILATRKLRWSSPELFNDPFDVPTSYDIEGSYADVQELAGRKLADLIEFGSEDLQLYRPGVQKIVHVARSSPAEVRLEMIRELTGQYESKEESFSETLLELRAETAILRKTARILCLTQENDNEAMWANYAEGYSGAVVRIDCIDSLDTSLVLAEPVRYSDHGTDLILKEYWAEHCLRNQTDAVLDYFSQLLHRKKSSWSYEKEWRVVDFARKNSVENYSDIAFDPSQLTEIYLGAKMNTGDIEDIESLLSHGLEHVELFQSELDRPTSTIRFKWIKPR